MELLCPDRILKADWNEWVKGSGIDPVLTSLNIVSLSNYEPHEYLLYGLAENDRRNSGVLRNKYLARYDHLYNGGWWCSGVNVLTGELEQWGCFKPKTPYQYQEKNQGFDPNSTTKIKQLKYEHPPKVDTGIFALAITLDLWKAIACRYNIQLPENIVVTPEGRAIGFWAWVINNPSIPVIITEGAKKAGTLLAAGYIAIALPGIYNGYRQPKNDFGQKIGKPYLIPQLEVFAHKEREIIFCFDNDTKPKTIKNVNKAIAKTGKLFVQKGCKVSVISWNSREKGVDDLIVAKGVEFFHALYENRVSLSKFNLLTFLDLSKYSPLVIDERYLSDNLVCPANAQVIGLKSAKGTGKTEWLARIVQKAIYNGQRVIILTHREQLAIALAHRFGVDYRTEIRTSVTKGVLGYSLCVDSLHPNANPPFNSEEWQEALVVIDEVEQVLWHTLDSITCQNNRVAIINSLKQLLQTAVGTGGKIFLADADLSSIALDYIKALIDYPVNTWVVENKHNPNQGKRILINYSGNDPRKLVTNLVKHVEGGEKVLIHTTGQKIESKWGTTNLEFYLKKEFPSLRILRIDRESVSEPGHPAYGCMGNLNALLPLYDIVICSPVIETGVSIDIRSHFNSVWCIAYGVQTVDAVCQTPERLRDDVPRHIWVTNSAKNNHIGNGCTSIKSLLFSQHKATDANMRLLQQADIDDFDDLDVNFSPESLNIWAKRACVVNEGKNNYRDSVLSKLREEGYKIIHFSKDNSDLEQLINQNLKDTRDNNYSDYVQEVPKAETPSDSELKELKNKRTKTKTERLKERKGTLSKRYGVEVTPELVKKDDKGWYSNLKLHYYFGVGNSCLPHRDKNALLSLTENSKGLAFKPDVNKNTISAKIQCLKLLQIEQFLDPLAEFTKASLFNWFKNLIEPNVFAIKTYLGLTINLETESPIAVVNKIIKSMFGLKLERKKQIRINGVPTRIYSGANSLIDNRTEVFEQWLERDKNKNFSLV